MPTSRAGNGARLISAELVDAIEDIVARVGFLSHAAAELGIHEKTLFTWCRRGEAEGEGIYFDFAQAVARGKHRAEANELERLDRRASKENDWKASAWKLEKMNRRVYGELSKDAGIDAFNRLVDALADRCEKNGTIGKADVYECATLAARGEV